MHKTHLLVSGLLAGTIVCETMVILHMRKSCGTLKIDHKSEDKDSYLFEIDNLDALSKKKYIRLKVDNDANLSQH